MASRTEQARRRVSESKPAMPPRQSPWQLVVSSTLLLIWILFLAWVVWRG